MLQLARSIGLECLNSFSGPFILLIGSDGLYETYKCLDRRCILVPALDDLLPKVFMLGAKRKESRHLCTSLPDSIEVMTFVFITKII